MAAAGFESVPTFTGKVPDSDGGVYSAQRHSPILASSCIHITHIGVCVVTRHRIFETPISKSIPIFSFDGGHNIFIF